MKMGVQHIKENTRINDGNMNNILNICIRSDSWNFHILVKANTWEIVQILLQENRNLK
jgi:hypothetical protein